MSLFMPRRPRRSGSKRSPRLPIWPSITGHRSFIRLERQPEADAGWLTLEIEEDPLLARCFGRVEVLLRGRAAPLPLGFHVGMFANIENQGHRTVGPFPVRLEDHGSRALVEFDLASEFARDGGEVTALKPRSSCPPAS